MMIINTSKTYEEFIQDKKDIDLFILDTSLSYSTYKKGFGYDNLINNVAISTINNKLMQTRGDCYLWTGIAINETVKFIEKKLKENKNLKNIELLKMLKDQFRNPNTELMQNICKRYNQHIMLLCGLKSEEIKLNESTKEEEIIEKVKKVYSEKNKEFFIEYSDGKIHKDSIMNQKTNCCILI